MTAIVGAVAIVIKVRFRIGGGARVARAVGERDGAAIRTRLLRKEVVANVARRPILAEEVLRKLGETCLSRQPVDDLIAWREDGRTEAMMINLTLLLPQLPGCAVP